MPLAGGELLGYPLPMLELDRPEVIRALPGGVVLVGAAPLCQGDLARVGPGLGLVESLLRHEARVALVTGSPAPPGTPVSPGPPLGFAVGEGLLGRVVDPLGQPLDGEPVPAVQRAAPPPPPRAVRALPAALVTGVLSVDALCPLGRGRSLLLTGASSTHRVELAATALGLPRDASQVLMAPAVSRSALSRLVSGLGANRQRTAVIASPAELPPMAHLLCLQAGLTAASWLCHAGHQVLVAAVELDSAARAAKALRKPLGWARDGWGWPIALSARIAALTDQTTAGPGSLSVLATAGTDEPGLTDHLVPWFDHSAALHTISRPGMLAVVCPDCSPDPALLPPEHRQAVHTLRERILSLGERRELARITRDPELREQVAQADALLESLSQRAGSHRSLDELS